MRCQFLLLLLPALLAFGEDADDAYAARHLKNQTRAITWLESLPKNDNVKTWPGIHADKAAKTVTVLAESTGLSRNTTIEFPLAGMISNHDYEALALMLGKPSELAAAVEWIGMPRGTPTSRRGARFWPKGERMSVTIARLPDNAEAPSPAQPIGAWIKDNAANGPAFTNNFVYTGSTWTDGECAADGDAPGSVIATFNEPLSLFDVPELAEKGEVYGRYASSTPALEKGSLLVYTFATEARAVPRLLTLSVLAKPVADPPKNLADLRFDATSKDTGWEDLADVNALSLFERIMPLIPERDVFVQWTLDDRLTVLTAAQLAAAIASVEGRSGIRVDGPPAGQLYYRAFLPNPDWIPREERLLQPFELHLAKNEDGTWQRTFISIDEDWSAPDKLTPDLTVNRHPLADDWQTALPKILAEKDPEKHKSALFIFTPPETPLSTFMPIVRLLHFHLYEVHVFGEGSPE